MKRTGFTLIEMVIVIIIVLVMAAVLVPSYSRFYARAQFDGQVRDVQDVFGYAREQAITNDATTTLEFDQQSETFVVSMTPAPPPADQPSNFPDPNANSSNIPPVHVVQLDPRYRVANFSGADTSTLNSGTGAAPMNSGGRSGGSTMIHFRSDGTSDGAELALMDPANGYAAQMTLLPGTARLVLKEDGGQANGQ